MLYGALRYLFLEFPFRTPLSLSPKRQQGAVVESLLDRGAYQEAVDKNGKKPYDGAKEAW
jgi:hypothetical protein